MRWRTPFPRSINSKLKGSQRIFKSIDVTNCHGLWCSLIIRLATCWFACYSKKKTIVPVRKYTSCSNVYSSSSSHNLSKDFLNNKCRMPDKQGYNSLCSCYTYVMPLARIIKFTLRQNLVLFIINNKKLMVYFSNRRY